VVAGWAAARAAQQRAERQTLMRRLTRAGVMFAKAKVTID